MNTDSQAHELLSKMHMLQGEIDACRKEIDLLKAEINGLKHNAVLTTSTKQVVSPTQSTSPTFENFIGLKVIHFVGIIVLLIGLAIGVKYAIDINLISPFLRIIIAYIVGCSLFFMSLALKEKYTGFSMVLFSGAMASIYCTTYAAFAYYGMLPKTITFVLMLLFTALTVVFALKFNKKEIAILGLVGAYGVPFFVRGNVENLWGLFSYIFIINAGILFISLRKYWLSLTYLSFFTTWIILFASLMLKRIDNSFHPQLVFSIAFFVLFLLASVGFKIYKRYEINLADTIIIIANTVALYSSLMIIYTTHDESFKANMTLWFAVVYLVAGVAAKTLLQLQRHLYSTLFSIALAALVIYFLLQYDGLTVTIILGLLAIIYFISGMWWNLKIFRVGAIALFVGTLMKLVAIDSLNFSAVEKIIAYLFTGTIILIVSFLYQKFKKRIFGDPDSDGGVS